MAGNGQPLQGTLKAIGLHAGGLWRWLTRPAEVRRLANGFQIEGIRELLESYSLQTGKGE